MTGELVSHSACSLFRRAGDQARIEGARGLGRSVALPDLAAKPPLRPSPRA